MEQRSSCRNIKGDDWRSINDKVQCLIDEQRLEVYDVSGDFDKGHITGRHQVWHAMVVVGDDVFEMNGDALMPNGLNMWAGEVWEWDDFMDRKRSNIITDIDLIPEQMKKAICQRYDYEEEE